MTNSFREEAQGERTIHIVVRFAGRSATSEEQGAQLIALRSQQVQKVAYAGDMTIEDIAKLMAYVTGNIGAYTGKVLYTDKAQLIGLLSERLHKILGRKNYDPKSRRYARSICNILRALELIDKEGDPTIYGTRLLRLWRSDRQSYCRYLGEMLLRKGGWTLAVVQLDALARMGGRKKDFHEALAEALQEKRAVRGPWSAETLVQCLIALGFVGPWDSFLRKYNIMWVTLTQTLRGST